MKMQNIAFLIPKRDKDAGETKELLTNKQTNKRRQKGRIEGGADDVDDDETLLWRFNQMVVSLIAVKVHVHQEHILVAFFLRKALN